MQIVPDSSRLSDSRRVLEDLVLELIKEVSNLRHLKRSPVEVHGSHYPLVMTNIANWNMTIEIVDFPSYKMAMFNSYVSG
jgi:hypothetical protein